MNCRTSTELWSSYCEGELGEEARQDLEEHLRRCRICAEGLSAFRDTLALMKDLPPLTPSSSFDARLARALAAERLAEAEPWYVKLGKLGLRAAPAAASVAVVFLISYYLASGNLPFVERGGRGTGDQVVHTLPPSGEYPVLASARAPVRVEPWSVSGQWPRALADSTARRYRMRFVLDRIILEGEEAARVPDEGGQVQTEYVTF